MVFNAAICCKAKAFIKQRIRAVFNPRIKQVTLQSTAVKLNPKIRGWLNYYSRFNPKIAGKVFVYLNVLIRRWIEEKFRLRSKMAVIEKYRMYVQENTKLFYHWQKGITYWLNNKSRMKGDFHVRFCERLKLKCFGLLDRSSLLICFCFKLLVNNFTSVNRRKFFKYQNHHQYLFVACYVFLKHHNDTTKSNQKSKRLLWSYPTKTRNVFSNKYNF